MSVSDQVKGQGRYEDAAKVALTAANDIAPNGKTSDSQLAVYGLLTVTASMAVACQPDKQSCADLLTEAEQVADRVGYECYAHETTFGPTKVAMLSTTLNVTLEDFGETLSAAKQVPRDADLPLATRTALLGNVALAHLRLGDDRKSLGALLLAESAAPECVKYQTFPLYAADCRQIASELLTREKRKSTRLRELAARIGAARMN